MSDAPITPKAATRARRIALGLCGECGLVECPPDRICDECRAIRRTKWHLYYAEGARRPHRGRPVLFHCGVCRKPGHNARSHAAPKPENACARCYSPRVEGRSLCAWHLEYDRLRAIESRRSEVA